MEAARARRGAESSRAPESLEEVTATATTVYPSAKIRRKLRAHRGAGSTGGGEFFNWILLLGIFALAAFVYVIDPGTRVAEWRLRKRHLQASDIQEGAAPLKDLEEDEEVVEVFSKLLNTEAEFGSLVGNFEEDVQQFAKFREDLEKADTATQEQEEALDARLQERQHNIQQAIDQREHEERLEAMYLPKSDAAAAYPHRPREAKAGHKKYELFQILRSASAPLTKRYHVDDNGRVVDPVEAAVSFTSMVSTTDDDPGFANALTSPSIIQWSAADEEQPVLVAAWEAPMDESLEAAGANTVYWSYSKDAGDSWEEPFRALPRGLGFTPQLFVSYEGDLWMFFTRPRVCTDPLKLENFGAHKGNTAKPSHGGDVMAILMPRLHARWSSPRKVFAQLSHSPPLQLTGPPVSSGGGSILLLPYWTEYRQGFSKCSAVSGEAEADHGKDSTWVTTAGVLISKDNGDTWKPGGKVAADIGVPMVGSTIVRIPAMEALRKMVANEEIVMFLHSPSGAIFRSSSLDLGTSWSWPTLLQVPNPVAKISVLDFQSSHLLVMALNNQPHSRSPGRSSGLCTGCLSKLSLAMSRDRGFTWSLVVVVDETSQDFLRVGWPSLVQPSDSEIALVYSRTMETGKGGGGIVGGIYFSRIDASNIQSFPLPVASSSMGDSRPKVAVTHKVVDHFLQTQRHSSLQRMNSDRPAWGDVADNLFRRYSFPGGAHAGVLASDSALQHYFFKGLEKEASSSSSGGRPFPASSGSVCHWLRLNRTKSTDNGFHLHLLLLHACSQGA